MMDKKQIILQICELDRTAKFNFLVNFNMKDLEHHLQVLRAPRHEDLARERDGMSEEPSHKAPRKHRKAA